MDRYTQAVKALESAYGHMMRVINYTRQLGECAEIRQNLTASYGTERVSVSKTNDNPAQKALECFEDRVEELKEKLAESVAVINHAKACIAMTKQCGDIADILDMHYLSGWSLRKIARANNCSVQTIRTKHNQGLEIIRQRTKNT